MTGTQVDPSMGQEPNLLPFEQNAAMLEDFSKRSALATQDKVPFQDMIGSGAVKSVTYDKNGLSMSGMDPRLVVGMMEKSKRLDMIMGAMAQEQQRLQTQREQLDTTGGKIGNVLSVLAGNMASAPNMPGWVQAAGRTALELNPSQDRLTREQMQLGQQEATIGQAQERIFEARMRAEEIAAYREAENERKTQYGLAREEDRKKGRELELVKIEEKKKADFDKRSQDEKKRIDAEIVRTDGKIDLKALDENKYLTPGDRAQLRATAEGMQKAVTDRNYLKVSLQRSRNDTKMAVTTAVVEGKKALSTMHLYRPEDQTKMRLKVRDLIQKAETKLADKKVLIEENLVTDPIKKAELRIEYRKAEEEVLELRKIKDEIDKGEAGPSAGNKPVEIKPTADNPLGLKIR